METVGRVAEAHIVGNACICSARTEKAPLCLTFALPRNFLLCRSEKRNLCD